MNYWIIPVAIAAFVIGALWRRMFGGWEGWPRVALLASAAFVMGLAWQPYYDYMGVDFLSRCICAGGVGVIFALHFDLGVDFNNHWLCALRYSLGPVAVGLATGQWSWLLIGPAISAVYWIGRDSTDAGKPWNVTWPWDTPTQQMTQGYTTFGELTAGGLSMMMFVCAPLIAAGALS